MRMRKLRVLVACECSGRVRDAFAARDWEAWSADILPSASLVSENYPNGRVSLIADPGTHHYQGDARDLFNWNHPVNADRSANERNVKAGVRAPPLWDLIIAHPPCDHLSYAGARWFKVKQADGRQAAAAEFFMEMVNSPSPLVAVENPHSIMQKLYRPPDCVVQPWWFGDGYIKAIHLWLKGLPPLWPDSPVEPACRAATGGGSWRTDKAAGRSAMSLFEDSEGRKNRARVRSRTFPGLARAFADQWGPFAEEHYRRQEA